MTTSDMSPIHRSVNTMLLVGGFIGILTLVYHDYFYVPAKIKECNDIAVTFEKARHYPVDDLEVTNIDIASYMKNVVNCYAD